MPDPKTSTATTSERIRVEPGAKRVRAFLGGVAVADTIRPLLVWEAPYYPTYYFPPEDVREEALEAEGSVAHSPSRGDAQRLTVSAGGKRVEGAALRYEDSPVEELRGLIRFEWEAMDAWFEEDQEIFTHPRDPYTRLDILPSSRRLRIELDGVTIAESSSPTLLFETGLPVRYYLPKTHVRLDLLQAGGKVTHCPYKGRAEHLSAHLGETVHEDVAWWYAAPLPESERIAGLIAFYDERADVFVDGVRQERPQTKFG